MADTENIHSKPYPNTNTHPLIRKERMLLLMREPYKARLVNPFRAFSYSPQKIIAYSVPTMQFFFLQTQTFVHGLAQQTSSWQLVSYLTTPNAATKELSDWNPSIPIYFCRQTIKIDKYED